MIHSISAWQYAESPNYVTNVDLVYPYSEVPYIGNYKLVKIPISTTDSIVPTSELLDHVDYWGEGRLTESGSSSGFPNCYNVNHQYQLVSNGPDRDKKIPNRIPVISYTNCNTSSYIKDNSVKLVTLMGAPINRSCAQDMARMVHPDLGQVIVYGFKSDASDIKNLEEKLTKKKILYCQGYKLNELLKSVSLFSEDDHRAYLNISDLNRELYRNIIEGTYDNATQVAKILVDNENSVSVVDVITTLLKEGKRNIMTFAYHLWLNNGQSIVSNLFPIPFKLILNQDYVKIISKQDLWTVKLDPNLDANNEKVAFADDKDKESPRLRWKIVPEMENGVLLFKIINIENVMFLKLDGDSADKESKGSASLSGAKSQWYIDPIKFEDNMLFYILNKEYNQGLKLDEVADSNGKKRLLGHSGSVYGQPSKYGWYIAPW